MSLIPRTMIYLTAALSGVAIGYSLPSGLPETVTQTGAVIAAPPSTGTDAAPRGDIAPRLVEASNDPAWVLRTEPAVFDDLTNVYLSVPSDQPLRCGPRRRASLMLRCLEDRTAIYIAHDCATPLMDPEGWDVDLRLDQAEIQSINLPVDSHGEAFGHWTYREARTLMEALVDAETLSVRFSDLTGIESQMSFPVAGLVEPLETLTQACHWSAVPPWEQINVPGGSKPDDVPVASVPEAPASPPDAPVIASASATPPPDPNVEALDEVSLTSGSTRSFVLAPGGRPANSPASADPRQTQTGRPIRPDAPESTAGLTMGERRLLEHDRDIAGD